MNKYRQKLEYDKIVLQLVEKASFSMGKERCLMLEPMNGLAEVTAATQVATVIMPCTASVFTGLSFIMESTNSTISALTLWLSIETGMVEKARVFWRFIE